MSKHGIRLEDLAELAQVSIATVSRALNNSSLVREETKRRIWKLAREHQYAFRPEMPAMLSGASAEIAIVIPPSLGRRSGLGDPFFSELIGGIVEAARDLECDIVISHLAPKNLDDLSELMPSTRAQGVIFLGQSVLHERYNTLAKTETNFVVWGADLPGQRYCSVGSDNIRGGQRATSHLIRLGRQQIAFFGDTEAPEIMQRYTGYVQALEDAGLKADSRLVLPVHFDVESAEYGIDRLMAEGLKVDAIFAASDLVALGVVRGLVRHGVCVPEDVSVVGYDDLLIARYNVPALTTIAQNSIMAGRLLVSKLMSATQGQEIKSARLPTDLIIRETCGA